MFERPQRALDWALTYCADRSNPAGCPTRLPSTTIIFSFLCLTVKHNRRGFAKFLRLIVHNDAMRDEFVVACSSSKPSQGC